jgi:hypothetical protein
MRTWLSTKMPTGSAGKNWILHAVDAFNDGVLPKPAYPDGSGVQHVVHEVTVACTVTAPPGLADGATWECAVFNNSHYNGVTSENSPSRAKQTMGMTQKVSVPVKGTASTWYATNNDFKLPYTDLPVQIVRGPDGLDLTSANIDPANIGGIDIPTRFTSSEHRVVGMAMETTNGTNVLNVGGEVSCFEAPMRRTPQITDVVLAMQTETGVWLTWVDDANPAGAFPAGWASGAAFALPNTYSRSEVDLVTAPPATLGVVKTMTGTETWHAKEGSYQNVKWTKPPEWQKRRARLVAYQGALLADPNAKGTERGQLVLPHTQSNGGTVVTNMNASKAPTFWNNAGAKEVKDPLFYDVTMGESQVGTLDCTRKGAWFYGLPKGTVLTVTAKFFIERMPAPTELDVYTLADPSPAFDPAVWDVYSLVASKLPVGCMQTENPLGEWLHRAAGVVAKFAPIIGEALGTAGVPGAKLAAGQIKGLAGLVEKATQKAADAAATRQAAYDREVLKIPPPMPNYPPPSAPKKSNHGPKPGAKKAGRGRGKPK